MDWLKSIAVAALQSYIYGQKDDLIAWFAYLARKDAHAEWTMDGGLTVPPNDVVSYWKVVLKAVAATLQHGRPPVA